ncbi:MAG: Ig-like domain-containing protein, partial [Candidatus Bathyarchaeia archaeon]
MYPGSVTAATGSSISIAVVPLTFTLGNSVSVTGNMTPALPSAQITIRYTRPNGTVVTRETITSMHSSFADVYTPDLIGTWYVMASWSGNQNYAGATSSSVSFTVTQLSIGVSSITCKTDFSSTIKGRSINISGRLSPALVAPITIEISTDSGTTWRLLATVSSASNGTYQFTWTPASTGAYLIRASWTGDTIAAGATSPPTSVNVNPLFVPDFNITVSPPTQMINAGETAEFTITITSLYGFNSSVFLNATGLPTDATASFSPGTISGSGTSTLILITSASTPIGTSGVQISATGGGRVRLMQIFLVVTSMATSSTTTSSSTTSSTTTTAAAQHCLIATATYGSELSPEVQILRDFRDNTIQRTKAGASFMIIFNTWYYSFSPYVASYLTDHSEPRTVMKGVLYPVVVILLFASKLFSATSAYPELGVLLAGLFASVLIGAIYLGLPLSVLRLKIRWRRNRLTTRLLVAAFLLGIAILIVGEIMSSPVMLMVSPVIVLSTMLLSGLAISAVISEKITECEQRTECK